MGVRENLGEIGRNIGKACERSGRKIGSVSLVVVSKNNAPERIMEAYDAGVRDFGENRVQELLGKVDVLPGDIRWHLIGHLQRNKVKYVVGKVVLIHSVDSLRLAEEISREAVKRGIVQDILIEVNVAGEESKYGVSAQGAFKLTEYALALPGLRVRGLMAIAPFVEDGEDNRRYFANLRQLSVDITSKNVDNTFRDNFNILSMGMTGDYEVAVEEGAVLLRIGTGVFG